MTVNKYLACQDKKILGMFDSEEEARARIIEEQRKDLLWLIIHKKLVKLIYKGQADYPSTVYHICKVEEVVENAFF